MSEYTEKNNTSSDVFSRYAPYCKEFYERAIRLVDEIEPFCDDELQELTHIYAKPFPQHCLLASLHYKHISCEAYERCIALFNDIKKYQSETGAHLEFVTDMFAELYRKYLKIE